MKIQRITEKTAKIGQKTNKAVKLEKINREIKNLENGKKTCSITKENERNPVKICKMAKKLLKF